MITKLHVHGHCNSFLLAFKFCENPTDLRLFYYATKRTTLSNLFPKCISYSQFLLNYIQRNVTVLIFVYFGNAAASECENILIFF